MTDGIDLSAFMGQFKDEAAELVQKLIAGLMHLETEPGDPETMEEIARAAHTLKGSSKMMGLEEVNRIAHRMEDLLVAVRDGELEFASEMSELLFEGMDAIEAFLEAAGTDEQPDADAEELAARIGACVDSGGQAPAPAEPAPPPPEPAAEAEAPPPPEAPPVEEPAEEALPPGVDLTAFEARFREEAVELIQNITAGFMHLETNPGESETIDEIARAAHTLKGSSKMMGFEGINLIAHKMEDILVAVRDGEFELSGSLIEQLFDGVDAIEAVLQGSEAEVDVPGLTQKLGSAFEAAKEAGPPAEAGAEAEEAAAEPPTPEAEAQEPAAQPAPSGGDYPTVSGDLSAFMGRFKDEADELINKLNQGLLDIEGDAIDGALMAEITRAAHTLKGSSKMMGLEGVNQIAHKMEDLFEGVGKGTIKLTDDAMDVLFEALDAIDSLLKAAVGGGPVTEDMESICTHLDVVIGGTSAGVAAASPAEAPAAPPARAAAAPPKPPPKATAEPAPSTPPPAKPTSAGAPPKPKPAPAKKPKAMPDETIRVAMSRIDDLVNLTGEMVISQIRTEDRLGSLRNLLLQTKEQSKIWSNIRGILDGGHGLSLPDPEANPLARELLESIQKYEEMVSSVSDDFSTIFRQITDDAVQLGLATNELQQNAMGMRMLPVATVFNTFPRAVRDLAKERNKKIRLEIAGAETELDKKMLEGIKDPLMHLVRNCVDHGIEEPAVREEVGKPDEGMLRLAAYQEGDHVIIEIKDDGKGIDAQKIKESAVSKGVIDALEAEAMSDREAVELIFRPGFSTAKQVTDISGRGVGMDVVKKNIEDLKGEVLIESTPGKGTRTLLSLPLTLAVTRVLLVELRSELFAIPTAAVAYAHMVNRTEIRSIEGKQALFARGATVPLVDLSEILRLGQTELRDNGRLPVVVMHHAQQQLGFVVERIIGEQEIVIKNLTGPLRRVEKVAGAAILGSGDLVVVLHVPDLFGSSRTVASEALLPGEQEAAPREAPRDAAKRILVVEDSLTTRELEKNILEACGYRVKVAGDGLEGLHVLSEEEVDLVITDVQMPRLDGLEMTRKLKNDPRFQDIPVIAVTSLERDEDKRKGMEVGVDAYLVKSSFDQSSLLECIERLVQ